MNIPFTYFPLNIEEELSMLHYAPFFERFGAYEHLFDAKWPKECRKIRSWWDAMQERQSYLETFLPTESHIATYSNMMQRIAS